MIWPWLIFVAVLGACVGSFLNVVIYRLPEGQSIVSPPSSCPKCGHRLASYDNVPVLGWLWLRGRCRYCRTPISIQYPIIEAATAILFGGWFYICYMTDLRPGFAGPGLEATWLIFAVNAVLLAALVASTMIDAKFYIIPLEIPWLATAAAVVLLPAAVAMHPEAVRTVELPPGFTNALRLDAVEEPYDRSAAARIAVEWDRVGPVEVSAAPLVSGRAAVAAVGATVGLIVAIGLLWTGVLPRSFEDEHHDQPKDEDAAPEAGPADGLDPDDPHNWLAHPHPRREVLKECLFLALPILGAVAGYALADADGGGAAAFRVLGGALMGYLVGGATVWGMRVFGTLGFGKEAMGLGDVHLMAAVGAVCGWEVAVLAFFIAPFFGLTWALASAGAAKLLRRQVKMIPYGPHLAAATVLVMILREPLVAHFGVLVN